MATTSTEPPPSGSLAEPRAASRRRVAANHWLRAIVLPIALYLGLALLVFSPHDPFNATTLPQGAVGDPPQMTWFLAYSPWALLHGHNPLVTNYLDYPSGVNLGSNTSVPLLGVLAAPVTLTLGPIAALNVLLRLSLALSAAALYFVLRRWCASNLAAFAGGLAYGFGPYLVTQLRAEGHLNLIFAPIPALLLAVFDEAFVRQRRRAETVGLAAGLLGTAQLLISPEVLSDVAIVGLVALIGLAAAYRHDVRQRVAYGLRVVGVSIVAFGLTAGFPLYETLAGPGHVRGAVQSVSHLQSFRTDLLEFVLPTSNALAAPAAAVRAAATATAPLRHAGGGAEIGGYLGIPLLLLLLVVVVVFRRDRLVTALGALAVVAAVASLGSRLDVDGHVTAIRLPEAVLAHLPLLDNTVPARFGLLTALFTAALLAVGLDRTLAVGGLHDRLVHPALRASAGLVAGVLALGVLALVGLAPTLPVLREQPATSPGVTAVLDRAVPAGSVVLAYPYPDPPYDIAMLWQADAKMGFRLLGGYATINGPRGRSQIYGPLLEPALLQETLTAIEAGRARHYPAPAPGGNVRAALCRYLDANGVGTVVYTPTGRDTASVQLLFSDALGAPSTRGAGLEIWRLGTGPGARSCRSST